MYRMGETHQNIQSFESDNSMNESDGNTRTVNYEIQMPKVSRHSITQRNERHTGDETVLPKRSHSPACIVMPSKKIFTRRKQSQIDVNGPNLHNIEVLQTLRVPKHALEYDLGNGDCEEGSERLNDNFSKYSVGVTENYGYFSYRKDYQNIENPSSRSKSRIPRYYSGRCVKIN